ncbi:MAG: hypothetical protein QOE89_1479 [Pseudonocardiales bacterium]|nr:hypothetical protein [Pseudonocardiales bacterium]
MRVRRTRNDDVAALRERATWVEMVAAVAIAGALGLLGGLIGIGPAAWIAVPLSIGGAIGASTRRAARTRDLRARAAP